MPRLAKDGGQSEECGWKLTTPCMFRVAAVLEISGVDNRSVIFAFLSRPRRACREEHETGVFRYLRKTRYVVNSKNLLETNIQHVDFSSKVHTK
jgi:hypothetical protein